jgi:hypothetical protein
MFLCEDYARTPPQRPPTGVPALEDSEKLNPFVYQENAGRANSHKDLLEPEAAREVAFESQLGL